MTTGRGFIDRVGAVARVGAIAVLPAGVLPATCTPDGDSASGGATSFDVTTTVDTIDGVVRVSNAGTPPRWQLTQVASIGPKSLSETGSPDEFGRVYDVALGPDGNVFVADGANREIRVFGLDGVHRRTLGRKGEGPGEFDGLYSVAWLGDRLLALDPHLGRISEFSAEGAYRGQRRIRGALSGGPGWVRFYPVGADEAYRVTLAADPAPGRWWEYIGLDSRGGTADTLLQLPGPGAATIHCEVGDRISFFQVPFGPKLVQRPGPGGVMHSAITDAYRIALTDTDDDTVRVIERSLRAETISDDEWAEGNSGYRALRDSFPLMSCDPRLPPRPDAKPLIEQIDIASDGKLWVEVIRESGNRWEVFDAKGRLVASVPVPTERHYLLPPAINADHILTVRRGDLDLEYLDVWRINKVVSASPVSKAPAASPPNESSGRLPSGTR